MKKKRTFFVLIVAVFLITLTTKVMANFESSNYTKFNGWEGLGNIISTGDEVFFKDYQYVIYFDKNNNFVLANFASDNIYDTTYVEEKTYNYSDNEYYTSKEECEEQMEYYSPDQLTCNDTSYTEKWNSYYQYKEIPIGKPITELITDVSCTTAQEESEKCYIDSYTRGDNYKNIDFYQFLGYTTDINSLFANFSFTDEEKNRINQLVDDYFNEDHIDYDGNVDNTYKRAFIVYKENDYSDVSLEVNEMEKNETGTAKIVSTNPQNIDFIVFSVNDETINVKNIQVSDNWELSTFTDTIEEYDEIQNEYIDIESTFYSLKNKNHTQDNLIATIQIEGKEKITNDTIILKEYQQIESIRAFVKDGTHFLTYACGSEFYYKGGGCSSPYQGPNLGGLYYQVSENTFYYPKYCVAAIGEDVEYKEYKVSVITTNIVPNKKIIKYSSEKSTMINNNPKTGNNFYNLILSLGIIIIFSIILKKQDKREKYNK